MKDLNSKFLLVVILWVGLLAGSCTKDLLDQTPTSEVKLEYFWKTPNDAIYALNGAYAAVRPVFDRDYHFDGLGEYVRSRSNTNSTTNDNLRLGDAYRDNWDNPSSYTDFDKMYRYLYGGINRTNYVIDNVTNMIPEAKPEDVAGLELVINEARLLRGMCYFKLISMWGDVPLIDHTIYANSEVSALPRTPITQVKDFIMTDFTAAFNGLPAKPSSVGRAGKPAALAFRGKLQLYWACWKNFGWPELDGFTQNAAEAATAYAAAAEDFRAVIDNYGLKLYKNGEPGEIDDLGKAEKLPNYYYLFTPLANGDPEMIMVFTHGGTGTSQGEELMRDFAGRSHEGSQCWVVPRFEIADRYQSIITGDFCPALIGLDPNGITGGVPNRQVLNSAVNPQSYADRDYRMKSSIQWDYEVSIGMTSLQSDGWVPYIYKNWAGKVTLNIDDGPKVYTTYNTDGTNSGYVFRKFVRNYAGQGRSDGNFNWPVMRLADVYLMYAEAINEVNGGPDQKAIDLVNAIRYRGNLPPLASAKTATKEDFFSAVEQERIVELFGEGQRHFDIRRWRAIERVWCPPLGAGVWRKDTWGANQTRYFQNSSTQVYERCYIFRIPPSERNKNPNLTQNKPWY